MSIFLGYYSKDHFGANIAFPVVSILTSSLNHIARAFKHLSLVNLCSRLQQKTLDNPLFHPKTSTIWIKSVRDLMSDFDKQRLKLPDVPRDNICDSNRRITTGELLFFSFVSLSNLATFTERGTYYNVLSKLSFNEE